MNDQARNKCICSDDGFIYDFLKTVYVQCECAITQVTADTFYRHCNGTDTPPDKNVDEMMIEASGNPKCPPPGSGPGGLSTAQIIIIALVAPVVGVPGAVLAIVQILVRLGVIKDKNAWAYINRRLCCCCQTRRTAAAAPDDLQPLQQIQRIQGAQQVQQV